jgi:hypothetical protein
MKSLEFNADIAQHFVAPRTADLNTPLSVMQLVTIHTTVTFGKYRPINTAGAQP